MSLLSDESITTAQQEANQAEGQENSTQAQASDTTTWWWDDNTPGTGERPQWLPTKYKSAADIAKAHSELEKRLGSAPNEYDFSKGESWIEPDYEPFQDMAEFAKQNHVPQTVMDKMLETVGLYLDEFKTDLSEEKAKLGENASERLQVLNNWAKSNLSEKAFQVLSGSMRTADAIEALEEIREKMLNNNTLVPNNNASVAGSGMTLEEYRSELGENYTKYKNDPHYRKQMERKLEQIVMRNK